MNMRYLFIILVFWEYSGFSQNLPNSFETIKFNAKKIVFTESLGNLTIFKNQDDYNQLWQIFNAAYTVELVQNEGFNKHTSINDICFIKVEYKKQDTLPAKNIKVNDYALDNLYILGIGRVERVIKFYKLKGFVENDFKQFAFDLPKIIPYSYKELFNEKDILKYFSIESVDLECLYYKYIKNKKISCDKPNKIRNAKLFNQPTFNSK